MNIYNKYLSKILITITELIEENDWKLNNKTFLEKIVLEQPKNISFGDMSTNAAMILASEIKINPIEIANLLIPKIKLIQGVQDVTFIKPGFINIIYNINIWHEFLYDLLSKENGWTFENIGLNKKINVEYISANPTGPLHAGHARGAVFGDALSSILETIGYDVIREYYINDAGKQIEVLVKSAFLRYLEVLENKQYEIPNGWYPGEYLKEIGKKIFNKFGDTLQNLSFDQYFYKIKDITLDSMLKKIKIDLKKLGVTMNVYTSEEKIIKSGKLNKVLKILENKNLLYTGVLEKPKGDLNEDWEPRPQLLFKSKTFGDQSDRALKKSDDTWTYFASDIAYHLDKLERTNGDLINILGADHGGYTSRITSAVKALSNKDITLTNKICAIVHLSEAGKKIKMSKRSGNFVTLSEIINKVGKDALRFIMLTRRNDQSLDFDFTKAKEQNKENPVFYVHYAFARCSSIIKSSKINSSELTINKIKNLVLEDEINLIKLLALWPKVIENSAKHLEPHRVCFFLIELASAFHSFWNKGKQDPNLKFIKENNVGITIARISLVKSIALTIKSGLSVLSIEPMEKM